MCISDVAYSHFFFLYEFDHVISHIVLYMFCRSEEASDGSVDLVSPGFIENSMVKGAKL